MNKLMTVAVIDSGIYPHIDFKSRVLWAKEEKIGKEIADGKMKAEYSERINRRPVINKKVPIFLKTTN